MARPADWYVLDMDSDPTPGDPARVRQLASRFHDFAETAHKAKLAVESLQGDGAVLTWVGMSGDAFRDQFGEFPSQVNKLYQSHLMVGDALDTYAPVLETAQAQADRALADGRIAADKLTGLQGALGNAQTDFSGASQKAQQAQAETQSPDPDQVKQAVQDADAAKQRLSGAQNAVNGAQHELDLAKQLAEQARQMRDGAAKATQRDIDDASDVGIQPRSFWEKLGDALKALWDIICEVAKWVALVAGIIAMIIGGPLAWIALAAGAILLVKAIVDFSQGKGSVMDLVFAVLGIIPGVKGLTTLSKLSALYKAGGVKEIAKAALTGMKDMAKDMVGLVKAAGQGAVTIVKKLGDTSTSVIGAVKSAGVVLGDAIKTGGAKIDDLFIGGDTKPFRDMPAPGGGKDFGAPAASASGAGTTVKNFTQQFDDLKIAKVTDENTELGKIKTDFDAKFQTEKTSIETKFTTDVNVKTGEIKLDYAGKLDAGKINIEKTFTDDLKIKTDEITKGYDAKIDVGKAAVETKYTNLEHAKIPEIQAHYDQIVAGKTAEFQTEFTGKLNQLDQYANHQVQAFDQQIHNVQAAGGDAKPFLDAKNDYISNFLNKDRPAAEAGFQKDFNLQLDGLHADALKAATGDLAAYVKTLDVPKAAELGQVETGFRAAQTADIAAATKGLEQIRANDIADLAKNLNAAEVKDIAAATAGLDQIKVGDIAAAQNKFNGLRDTDLLAKQGEIDLRYDGLTTQLNHHMLDGVAENVPINGTNVKVLFNSPGADATDLVTVIDRNVPELPNINPGKLPTDVNCTICVQRVDDLIKTGSFVPAHKLPHPMPLNTIEANYTGMKFVQTGGFPDVVQRMANLPDGTVGIIGFRGPQLPGHVMNVMNIGGRVAFLDGQTGRLGSLPNLNIHPGGDELWFTPIP